MATGRNWREGEPLWSPKPKVTKRSPAETRRMLRWAAKACALAPCGVCGGEPRDCDCFDLERELEGAMAAEETIIDRKRRKK